MIQFKKSTLINVCLFLASTLVLLLPAFQNGFPLLFSDSATYLVSGHVNYSPVDRPIMYGLFVRHISLSWSVWLVIILQAILFNYLLLLLLQNFVRVKKAYFFLFVLCIILSFSTGLGYYVSQISADIFTSYTILGIFLIYFLPKSKWGHIAFLSIIVGYSIICHLSHLPIALALISILFIYDLAKKFKTRSSQIKRPRFLILIATIGISLLSLASINYSLGVGFKLSRASNIVIGARMIEAGLANRYLKVACEDPSFNPAYKNLCNYVDQFERWPAAGFYLHLEDSPLYDGDCYERDWTLCWTEKDAAYKELIGDILDDNVLRNDFIAMAISGTLKQLFIFEQSRLDPQEFSDLFQKYYPFDSYSFETSIQRKRAITFINENIREAFFVDLSIVLILILLFGNWKTIDANSKLFILFFLIALLANAFVCATFSNVVPRYQGRIIFLIPLLLILLVLKYFGENQKKYSLSMSDFFIVNLPS